MSGAQWTEDTVCRGRNSTKVWKGRHKQLALGTQEAVLGSGWEGGCCGARLGWSQAEGSRGGGLAGRGRGGREAGEEAHGPVKWMGWGRVRWRVRRWDTGTGTGKEGPTGTFSVKVVKPQISFCVIQPEVGAMLVGIC